jgi:Tol biopolymer transport system component
MIDAPQFREAILKQTRKITSSALFENAGRARALLDYLVREAVSGRGDQLKEYTIGSEGLGRGDSFDPRTDTIVRAEASRLRSRLERYYAAEGKADPLVVVLPRGGYVPEFHQRNVQPEPATIVPPSRIRARKFSWVAGAVTLGWLAVYAWRWNRKSVEAPLSTFEVELKAPGTIGALVGTDVIISPDGTRLVFASQSSDGVSHLSVHRLDRSQARELPGTEGARGQFFSHDGTWVGFWARGRLKKTALDGGTPVVLCEAADLQGASWAEDDSIIASFGDGKLWRVPASGGAPVIIPHVADDGGRPTAPQGIEGQNAVLFTLIGADPAQNRIAVHSLATGKTKVVARSGAYGRFVPPGYLTYIRQGTLYAVRFDTQRLEASGTPVPLLDGISFDSTFGLAQLDFSQTGTLVYRRNSGAVVQWLDESGRAEPIVAKPGYFVWPQLSPDGNQLAITTMEGGAATVSIHDLRTKQVRTATTGAMHFSLWTPDSRFLVLGGGNGLAWVPADLSSAPQALLPGGLQMPASFTRDGARLAFHSLDRATHFDLWTVSIHSASDHPTAGQPEVFLRTPAIETYPIFSPDGHWLAYASNESGVWEVYVRSFPDVGKAVRISSGGGRIARWSMTGRELFYRTDHHKIMVASYSIKAGQFRVEHVRPWTDKQLFDTGVLANYDVGRDGRIVALLPADRPEDRQSENHVTVKLNFFEEMRRRVALRESAR